MSAEITRKDIIDDDIKTAFEALNVSMKATLDTIEKLTVEANKMATALNGAGIKKVSDSNKEYQATLIAQQKAEQEAIKTQKLKIDLSEKERKANESKTKAAEKEAQQLAKTTTLYAQQSKALTDARNRAREVALQYGENSKQFKAAAKEVGVLDTRLKKIDSTLGQHNRNVGNYASAWKSAAGSIMGAMGITAGLTGLVSVLKNAHAQAVAFEKGLSSLSSITGLAGKQLQQLGKMARGMSTQYGIASVDTLKAMELIGSAKPELLENSVALASVTEQAIILAQAAGMELPEAASALTSIMNQMRMSASEGSNAINVLAAGSKVGAVPITYLAQAIEKAGTTAKMMGMSIEQVTGAIESIAPFYKDAATAGNSFEKVLMKLQAKQIGYKDGVFDLNRAIDELRVMYNNGTTAVQIFGEDHAKMGNLLVQNQAEFNKLTTAVTGTNTAIEQAAINTDNFAGASARLSAKWTDFLQTFSNTKFATKMVNGLSTALDSLASAMKSVDEKGEENATRLFKKIVPTDGTPEEQKKAVALRISVLQDQLAGLKKEGNDLNEEFGGIWESSKSGLMEFFSLGMNDTEVKSRIKEINAQIATRTALIKMLTDHTTELNKVETEAEKAKREAEEAAKKAEEERKKAEEEEESRKKGTTPKSNKFARKSFESLESISDVQIETAIDTAKEIEAIQDEAFANEVEKFRAKEKAMTEAAAEEAEARKEIQRQWEEFGFDVATQATDEIFAHRSMKRDEEAQKELDALHERLNNEALSDKQRVEIQKEIQKKEKASRKNKAKADKEDALFQIALNTGVAVSKAWSMGKPLEIPFIIASGLVQAGMVAARKIPEYFMGTDNHRGGLAIVGDGGKGAELITEPNGNRYLTPDTDTIMNLPKGTKVTANKDLNSELADIAQKEMLSLGLTRRKDLEPIYVNRLIDEQVKTREMMKKVLNRPQQDISANIRFELQREKMRQ